MRAFESWRALNSPSLAVPSRSGSPAGLIESWEELAGFAAAGEEGVEAVAAELLGLRLYSCRSSCAWPRPPAVALLAPPAAGPEGVAALGAGKSNASIALG